jgi:GntR family transcriptional regulator
MNVLVSTLPTGLRQQHRERRIDAARRFADLIRSGVVNGDATGPLVESELQAAYRTSRNTVRDALDLLRREGVVERVPGVGTFAVVRQARHVLDRLQGLSEGIEHGGTRVVHELITHQEVEAPAIVCHELRVDPGAPTLLVERLTRIDGDPVAVASHWLSPEASEALAGADFTRELFALYEETFGADVLGRSVIEAISADEGTAEQLRVPEGAALIRFERHVLAGSRTIEFGFMRCRGDRLALSACLSRRRLAVEPDLR